MTVTNQATQQTFIGDGIGKVFPYDIKIPSALNAFLYSIGDEDVESLIPSSQYSLSGLNNDAGGLLTYPLTGSALASGERIRLRRMMPFTQELDIRNQTGFLPEVVEQGLDALVMQIQQIAGLDASGSSVGDLTGILVDIQALQTAVADLQERMDDVEAGLVALSSDIAALEAAAATMGTYTPTSISGTLVNLDSVTYSALHWRKTGNQVDVWGTLGVDATAIGAIAVQFTLPVASNFLGSQDLSGLAINQNTSQVGTLDANSTNKAARFQYQAADSSNRTFNIRFSYEVR